MKLLDLLNTFNEDTQVQIYSSDAGVRLIPTYFKAKTLADILNKEYLTKEVRYCVIHDNTLKTFI